MKTSKNLRYTYFVLLLFAVFVLSGCNSLTSRVNNIHSLANENSFSNTLIHGDKFTINSFHKISDFTDNATIYIEGDGRAWLNKKRISQNPTPNKPVGFELALNDSGNNIIYLARPCQFLNLSEETQCTPEYWTSKRASKEVIQSLDDAINVLKKRFNIKSIRLVGYSGGATVAAILAANRNDVIDFRSIAGNLDIDVFSNYHNVSPLTGSINPVQYAEKLAHIPQLHYISRNDTVITNEITESYKSYLKEYDAKLRCVEIINTDVKSHASGWDIFWAQTSQGVAVCAQ